jgi:branched-chain amino acid transport system permease protein
MNKAWKRIGVVILLLFMILLPIIVRDGFYRHLMITTFINIILAMSLWLILRTGQLSIGHVALMAIGAYTSTLLTMRLGLSFWVGLSAGGVMSAAIALVIGYLTLRLKGLYFALVTFALAEVVRIVFNSIAPSLFGGPQGITGIPKPSIFGVQFASFLPFYYLIVVLMILAFLVVARIDKSRIGMIFSAINQADNLAESVGINIMKYKVMAFVVGSFIAGVAGSFFAHYFSYISADHFTFWTSVYVLIYVVVGGSGVILGPIIGACALTIASQGFRGLGDYEPVVFGSALILILLFLPDGLASLPGRLKDPALRVKGVVRTYLQARR